MIHLHGVHTKDFRFNGLPLPAVEKCVISETLNGQYFLDMVYPLTDDGSWKSIREGKIISAPTPRNGFQAFRITDVHEKTKAIEVNAIHVFYDLNRKLVNHVSINRLGGMSALELIFNKISSKHDFTYSSDIVDNHTFNFEESESVVSALLNGKHSMVSIWQGELLRDNFHIEVKQALGRFKGIVLSDKKNINDFERHIARDHIVTRIIAKSKFGYGDDAKELRVVVDSPLINSYETIHEAEYTNNDCETEKELIAWAKLKYSTDNIDKPKLNMTIKSELVDGVELHLGDSGMLKIQNHDIDVVMTCSGYTFDAIGQVYETLSFGEMKTSLAGAVQSFVGERLDASKQSSITEMDKLVEEASRNMNDVIDHKAQQLGDEIRDGVEQAKATAEEFKSELASKIDEDIGQIDAGTKLEFTRFNERLIDTSQLANTAKVLADEAKINLINAERELNSSIKNARELISTTERDLMSKIGELDSTRTAELQKYSREETAKQITAERSFISSNYVARSQYNEDVSGITQRFESLTVGARNYILNSGGEFSHMQTIFLSPDLPFQLPGVNNLTISCYTEGSNLKARSDGISPAIGINLQVVLDDDSLHRPGAFRRGLASHYRSRISTYWEVPKGRFIKRIDWVRPHINVDGYVRIGQPMLQINTTMNSDWVAAEEDNASYTTTKLAEYKQSVDGQFASVLASIDGKVSKTEMQQTTESIKTKAEKIYVDNLNSTVNQKITSVEQTAAGLKTTMQAVHQYINADGTRTTALQKYARDETARQINAERSVISTNYIAKAKYNEDVSGINQRFESLFVGTRNYILNSDEPMTHYKVLTLSPEFITQLPTIRSLVLSCYTAGNNLTPKEGATSYPGMGISMRVTLDDGTQISLSAYRRGLTSHYQTRIATKYTVPEGRRITGIDKFWSIINISGNVRVGQPMLQINTTLEADWVAAEEDSFSYTTTKIAEYKQTVDGKFASVQASVNGKLNKSETTLTPEGFMVAAGKIINGDTLASMITVKPSAITAITKKLSITGDLIVDGSITSKHIASKVITTGHLSAGSVTTAILAANAVTADKLVVNQAMVNKLLVSDLLINSMMAKSAFITRLKTIDLTATRIKGGTLVSLNNRTRFNLDTGVLDFHASDGLLQTRLDRDGMEFWKGSTPIGTVGTKVKLNDPSVRGIGFGLRPGGEFITFGYSNTNDKPYDAILTLDPKGRFSGESGLISSVDFKISSSKAIKANHFRTVGYTNEGMAGLQAMTIDGKRSTYYGSDTGGAGQAGIAFSQQGHCWLVYNGGFYDLGTLLAKVGMR